MTGRGSHDLGGFAAHLRAVGGLALNTADRYARQAEAFLGWLGDEYPGVGVGVTTGEHVSGYLVHEERRGMSASSRRLTLYALRRYYAWLMDTTEHTTPAYRMKAPRPGTPQTEAYSDAEAATILTHAADVSADDLHGRFRHALVATLRYTGLRESELVDARRDRLDLDAGNLRVIGKGSKQRIVPIPGPLSEILGAYLTDVRPETDPSPFVFANPRSHAAHRGRVSVRTVQATTWDCGTAAGVPGRHNPHKWRHTYATSLLRSGVDITIVQRLLGHSDIATTTRYLHLMDADLHAAVGRTFGT